LLVLLTGFAGDVPGIFFVPMPRSLGYDKWMETPIFGTLIAVRSQRARTQAEREELIICRSSLERDVSRSAM